MVRLVRGDEDRVRSVSDTELLSAHAQGDPRAFAELVGRHQDYLWGLARRTSRSPEDAADALQEALLSAHRRAGSFRGDAAVRSWLHRIVVNSCLDRMRRNQVRAAVPMPDFADGGPADTVDHYRQFETTMVVQEAIAALPDEQRQVIVAVDLQGLSVAETAELLSIPVGTVKSRASRGRLKLARLLEHLKDGQ
ncbi:RNA polymerase sigma factor SigM [Tomitella biformata]|uniref:RNA polymerase sigma factor SigM n=1 Tax=Tomitella biformata TaxID=630403 RepID=UPI00068632CC|nr:RNA polymerase sigma factor SigM [Tomitella biformata]